MSRTGARIEARVRSAWSGRPGPGIRAAAAAFGLAADARLFLYEVGILHARRPPVPVVSVGGLTVGGAGKTPLASDIARWLREAGRRPAIVTPGQWDELAVHRHLLPDVPVLGARDRWRAVREAAKRGARCAVLDDGFAHRGLSRALDLLLIDADALARTNRRRLPAGPLRHPTSAIGLAHAFIVTRRAADGALARRAADRLGRDPDHRPVALCTLRPGAARPANRTARTRAEPRPAVAVAGIMKPRLFFAAVRNRWPDLERLNSFRDHHGPRGPELESILRAAGTRGIVCTLKDAARLARRVGERTPLWYLDDIVEWERGASRIRRLVLERTVQSASP